MSNSLNDMRSKLDAIDEQVISLLAQRFMITNTIGEYKRDNNLPAIDSSREKIQFKRIKGLAIQEGLNPELAAKFLRLIIDEVVVNHKKISGQAS